MSERHICKIVGDNSWDFSPIYEADPEAPSVAEVVEVLRATSQSMDDAKYHDGELHQRIDNLIARLEGA